MQQDTLVGAPVTGEAQTPVYVHPESVRAVLKEVLEALKDDHAFDVVYDDLDVALGPVPPIPSEVVEFTSRLRRVLPQLVTIVRKRAGGQPTAAAGAVVERAEHVMHESVPGDPASARGHLRHLGLAVQDLLELVDPDGS
ncbi:DUF6415 family natural product biosynthesis protein [Streptomyces alboflavus]|uniref:DUF6415 family natural product biosynthesis protein n=1 Tax=Streptomyces alboflavus TaxID=67267 RepID=UPI001F021296|nr:DUF6415 family natural product biosynthesis protein [Streptomyces alboflavus]